MAAAAGADPGLLLHRGSVRRRPSVALGDYSGPAGARAVLRDPLVAFAVLETARGGILRRGSRGRARRRGGGHQHARRSFRRVRHRDADDLAETKLVVARAVSRGGTLVLNADDATSYGRRRNGCRTRSRSARALFAFDHAHPAPRGAAARRRQHLRRAATDSWCCIIAGAEHDRSARSARFAADASGARRATTSSICSPARWPGPRSAARWPRSSRTRRPLRCPPRRTIRAGWSAGAIEARLVLIDYAHNPDGLEQLLRAARSLNPAAPLVAARAGRKSRRRRDRRAGAHGSSLRARPHRDQGTDSDAARAEPRARCRPYPAGAPRGGCRRRSYSTGARRRDRGAESCSTPPNQGDVIVLPVHTREVREHLHATLDTGIGGESSSPNGDSNHILGNNAPNGRSKTPGK